MSNKEQTNENIDTLVKMLENTDTKVRRNARKSLVALGKPAVCALSSALEDSNVYKVRWEAAKALGAIGDAKAIPSLVTALEDPETDVAWLAAKALEKFGKAVWPKLLRTLIKRGSDSVLLRHGAHHVLRNQRVAGYNDLLEPLRKALESETVPESTALAALKILERMGERPEQDL
jgi:HEAT repeat protein